MTVTAKVIVTSASVQTDDDTGAPVHGRVTFGPDYADGRNKAWAYATPGLNLDMTLNGDVAGAFELGKRYTLSIDETVEEPTPVHEQPTENPFREVKTEEEEQEDRQELVDENEAAKAQWEEKDEDTVEDHSRDVPKSE